MAKKLVGTVDVSVHIFHGSGIHSYHDAYHARPMPELSSAGVLEVIGTNVNDRRQLYSRPEMAHWDKRSAILAIGSPGVTIRVTSPNRKIGAGPCESHASGNTLNAAETLRRQTWGLLQAAFAACTASTQAAAAAFRTMSQGDTFRIDVPEATKEKFPHVQGVAVDISPVHVLSFLDGFFDQAAEQIGGLYIEEPEGEPKIEGQAPSVTTRKTLSVKLPKGKQLSVSGTVKVPLYIDDSTDRWYVGTVTAADLTGPFAQAVAAANAYDRNLQTEMLRMMEGQPFVQPGSRPPETMSPDLTQEERTYMDNWWSAASRVRDSLQNKQPTSADDAYAKYAASHPNVPRAEWDATRSDRIEKTVGQLDGKQPGSNSFWDAAANGLGWVGDKASAGLAWAGDAVLDILKSWGPTGVVGAYAGVKTADKLVGGLSPTLIGVGVALLAIILLK